jgi:hypothetical protein
LCFMYAYDIEDIQAIRYEWKSPAHVDALGSDGTQGALAAQVDSGSMLQVAARAAFGSMPVTPLRAVAKELDLDCAGLDLFHVLKKLLDKILPGLPEEQVLKILRLRIQTPQLFEDVFLDDAVQEQLQDGMEEGEAQAMSSFAEGQKEKLKGMEAFVSSYRQASTDYRTRSAKQEGSASSSAKGKRKRQAGDQKAKRKPTKPPAICDSMTEQDLALWLPDASHRIWKDTFNCRWLWYFESKPRRSCSWSKWGFVAAAQKLVFCAWELHQAFGGDPPDFEVLDVADPAIP